MESAGSGADLRLDYFLDGDDVAVVAVAGEVDISTSGRLRESLLRVLTDEQGRCLVVNLAGVSFIDSTGIGVLVGVWHRVRATSSMLALAAPSRQVSAVLQTTGLTKMLSVHDTEHEAIQACRRAAGAAGGAGGGPGGR